MAPKKKDKTKTTSTGWDQPGTSADGYYFGEPRPEQQDSHFGTPVVDNKYYDKEFLIKSVQDVPSARSTEVYSLADVLGNSVVQKITKAGRTVFHSVGDTGPTTGPNSLDHVAEHMTADFSDTPADRPAFFFHLGDVVYNFGEEEYYYEQFYEPYRNYPGPIFAIPGNHDGLVYRTDKYTSLQSFQKHFCSKTPSHAGEAGGLLRTTMTQPGVYFALQAPLVTIIGLYSNALENHGVISDQRGAYPSLDDRQTKFLTARLEAAKNNDGATIVAVHHPPFSGDGTHGGSPNMLKDIDQCIENAKFSPHAILSGHAHIYQRYTRSVQYKFASDSYEVPCLVAGSGGHRVTPERSQKLTSTRTPKKHAKGVRMDKYIPDFGYLRITVNKDKMMIEFMQVNAQMGRTKSAADRVTVDLKSRKITATPISN
jgi:hypothetical protein